MSGVVGNDGTYNGVIGNIRPLKSKILLAQRNDNEGSGSISLTGCGFTPSACIVVSAIDYLAAGMGIASTQNEFHPVEDYAACIGIRASGFGSSSEFGRLNTDERDGKVVYRQSMYSTNHWYVDLTSWDGDGATFYCLKNTSGTADLYFRVLFMR